MLVKVGLGMSLVSMGTPHPPYAQLLSLQEAAFLWLSHPLVAVDLGRER